MDLRQAPPRRHGWEIWLILFYATAFGAGCLGALISQLGVPG